MDALGMCTSRHVRTVSLVVSAVDDLTGRVITGSNVRVWIEGAKPPIKKAEGWHVFLDLPKGEHTVLAEGGFYNRTATLCRITGDTLSTIKLRLTPGKNAPLPASTAFIEGKGIPGEKILVHPTDRTLSYKLLSEGKTGECTLGIFHPEGVDIEGKLFRICAPSGEEEYIRVCRANTQRPMEYQLSAPLTHVYPKIGTLVYPVSETVVSAHGTFFLPLTQLPGKPCTFCIRKETEEHEPRPLSLSAGERATVDMI